MAEVAARVNLFRGVLAEGAAVHVPEAEGLLYRHAPFFEAAHALSGLPLVVPDMLYVNVLLPAQELAIDGPVVRLPPTFNTRVSWTRMPCSTGSSGWGARRGAATSGAGHVAARRRRGSLTVDRVLARLVADLRARGLVGEELPGDTALALLSMNTYIRFPEA
jgi:hypothetical protein